MADKDFKVKSGLDLGAPLPITEGGTGQTSVENTRNAIMPVQSGHSGKFITTDGTNMSWAVAPQQTATDGATGNKVFAGNTAPTGQNIGDIWIDATTGNGIQLVRWRKTISAGASSISGLDDNNLTLTYTAGNEQVYINGTLITRGQDYTATNGTSISLTQAVEAGDTVEIFGNPLFSVTDTYTQSQANSVFVQNNNSNVAGKNAIINGGMDIWQRGTSISVSSSSQVYTADRWVTQTGANQALTISRQITSDNTNLPNIQYCMRYQRNLGQTGNNDLSIIQPIETANSIPLAGKTVTLSFYARAGANFSSSNSILYYIIRTGTGTDQNPYNAYSGGNTSISASIILTSNWQRFTATANIPAGTRQIAPQFYFTPTGTAGANDWYEITGVQLEVGSVATAFSRAAGTIQAELAACQRYYATSIPDGYNSSNFPIMGTPGSGGIIFTCSQGSTNDLLGNIQYPVPMRSTPSLSIFSGNNRTPGAVRDMVTGSDLTPTNIGVQSGQNKNFTYMSGVTATLNRHYGFHYIASAEL